MNLQTLLMTARVFSAMVDDGRKEIEKSLKAEWKDTKKFPRKKKKKIRKQLETRMYFASLPIFSTEWEENKKHKQNLPIKGKTK